MKPETYKTAEAIRALIAAHCDELVRERQEVKIRSTAVPFPITGIVRGYEPPSSSDAYRDALFIWSRAETVVIFDLGTLTSLEVLPTRMMTPQLANRQIDEMEAIVRRRRGP